MSCTSDIAFLVFDSIRGTSYVHGQAMHCLLGKLTAGNF